MAPRLSIYPLTLILNMKHGIHEFATHQVQRCFAVYLRIMEGIGEDLDQDRDGD